MRAGALARTDGLCADCLAAGRAVAATCVHHITPALRGRTAAEVEALVLSAANTVALCANCHRLRHRELNEGNAHGVERERQLVDRLGETFFGDASAPGGVFLEPPGGRENHNSGHPRGAEPEKPTIHHAN